MVSPIRTVHILRSPPSQRDAAAAIVVDGSAGVDLARIGLALGLDPASVRLNGYFLSRGPGHVSSAVTWRTLLAFFAKRGMPTGADAASPVIVHGKPAAPPTTPSDPTAQVSSKRKSKLEAERCTKKKSQEYRTTLSEPNYDPLSDEIILGLKRRLRLEDTGPAKKIKQVECSPDTQQPLKFSCSFVNGNGKRPLDEEMVASLSCKRVR
ncbi:hypothetical protein PR202_ga08497 [Eleusine coracana subsp. coracana]|uniref:Uncharacterized protein n=1 Tax=Eleusine coracana subsp. coracana TaxID=191504 RepID=A0AAV5C0E9_ELECO|nr:hypothetical protein PR202_ga08497 [Eleusine coracana subsp. coracana]